MMTITSTGLI